MKYDKAAKEINKAVELGVDVVDYLASINVHDETTEESLCYELDEVNRMLDEIKKTLNTSHLLFRQEYLS